MPRRLAKAPPPGYSYSMIDKFIKALFGSQHERDLKALLPILHAVNEKEAWALFLPEEEFPRQTVRFRERHAGGESLDSLLPEAFALAREASRRKLGERPRNQTRNGGQAGTARNRCRRNRRTRPPGPGRTLPEQPPPRSPCSPLARG